MQNKVIEEIFLLEFQGPNLLSFIKFKFQLNLGAQIIPEVPENQNTFPGFANLKRNNSFIITSEKFEHS